LKYDISKLSPRIAKSHSVDNGFSVEEMEGTKINQAFIGTCTNGRLEDLEIGAKIIKGKKVDKDTKLLSGPSFS